VPVRYRSNAVVVFCAETTLVETACQSIPQGIQETTVVTNDNGEFFFPLVNAGPFTLSVEDPSGRSGEARGTARAGERATLDVRLGGLGTLTVNVFRSDAQTRVPSARVTIRQVQHPYVERTLTADNNGSLTLTDLLGEGAFVVTATDLGAGVNGTGRASGRITEDGEAVTVNVYLYDNKGAVSGLVTRADGTPAVNTQVVISAGGTPISFAVTGADGRFREDHIPLGPFTIEAFEAATAARGRTSGRVDIANQEVAADIILDALGLIRGTVVEAGSMQPLRGWDVFLSLSTRGG
jgi:hypothetical protein